MAQLTFELKDTDYQHLVHVAEKVGKPIQTLFHEWIQQLPEVDDSPDVTQDPIFQMEGYDSEAPSDLSVHIDAYLYGEE